MNAEFSAAFFIAYVHAVLEQHLYRFHLLLTEMVRYFRNSVLEDISQGFLLLYRIVYGLSHQFVYPFAKPFFPH